MSSTFDHDGYVKRMEFLVSKAYDEYQYVCIKVPRHQAVYIRTYLWLATALGAFELAFFKQVIVGELKIQWLTGATAHFYMFAVLAFLLVLIAFVVGVDTLRGRGSGEMPFGKFMKLANMSYEDAATPGSCKAYATILDSLDKRIIDQTIKCTRRAKKLRSMSYLLLFSTAFSICSVIALSPQ